MQRRHGLSRRQLIAGASTFALAGFLHDDAGAEQSPAVTGARPRFQQSVCRWCYASIPLREFCQAVAKIGLTAIDLLTPDEWPVAREFGLTCSMGSGLGGPIERGLNDPANHNTIVDSLPSRHPAGGERRRAECDHVLRQPPRAKRQGGDRATA